MSDNSYTLKFGKHKDEPLEEVPVLYLDWLVGQHWLYDSVKKKIEDYLADPVVQRELNGMLEIRDNKEDG